MCKKKKLIINALCVLATILGTSQFALAEKGRVKAYAPMKPSQEREDYQQCLASVIKKYKAPLNPLKERRMEMGLAACRDRYPAASILAECKKEMTSGYKDHPQDLKAGLKQCQAEYRKYSFNPKTAIPFVLADDKPFFAGVGLNTPTILKETEEDETPAARYMGENFGNFSCLPLHDTMFGDRQPEYTLFGNDPFIYTPLRHVPKSSFFEALGADLKGRPKATIIHPEFGHMDYVAKGQSLVNFFPTSFCYFDRQIGPIYESIKIYYLVDRLSRTVTPYFGASFYKEKAAVPSKKLAEDIQKEMGKDYVISQPRPEVFLIATRKEFPLDSEGDPKNVCQKGNESPFIVSVISRDSSNLAAYSLFANIANLCRFGDRVASRFLKKGSLKPLADEAKPAAKPMGPEPKPAAKPIGPEPKPAAKPMGPEPKPETKAKATETKPSK